VAAIECTHGNSTQNLLHSRVVVESLQEAETTQPTNLQHWLIMNANRTTNQVSTTVLLCSGVHSEGLSTDDFESTAFGSLLCFSLEGPALLLTHDFGVTFLLGLEGVSIFVLHCSLTRVSLGPLLCPLSVNFALVAPRHTVLSDQLEWAFLCSISNWNTPIVPSSQENSSEDTSSCC